MKKIYAIIIVLVLLSASVFGVVATTVNAERDQVKITENILYGDKSVADGLEITTKNHMDHRLFWETDYTIGNVSLTNTEYSFYATQYFGEQNEHRCKGVQFRNSIQYGFNDDTLFSELEGVQKAYKELLDSTDYGEEKSKTVYLKDYYDYYPVGVGFDLPHTNWTGYDYGDVLKGEPYDALYVTEKFREYFKIPVLESDFVKISVERYDDNSYSTGTDENYCYQLYANGVVSKSKNRCFFSINNYKYVDFKNNTDVVEYVDTSLIPGGYGIYSFYYCGGDSAVRTGIMADKLETVYSLDKETSVYDISLNADETKLLLYTIEDKSSYLTVVDIETMTKLQKLLLDDSYIGSIYEYDDFIVADMEDSISVISVKDGVYSLDYNVQKASFIDENYQDLWNVDCMDYKDGKLALVGNHITEIEEVCDFFVSVYDKSGLIYYGVYDNSLDINRQNNAYVANCHPDDINPNKIKWN